MKKQKIKIVKCNGHNFDESVLVREQQGHASRGEKNNNGFDQNSDSQTSYTNFQILNIKTIIKHFKIVKFYYFWAF